MTLSIKIKNFAGAARAEFDATRIVLISGRNGAGKSSVLQAVAAAVSGDMLTRSITVKKEAQSLVKDGADGGVVSLRKADGGYIIARYPSLERETEGRAPHGHPLALGSDSLALLKPEERARVLTEMLPNALPTKEDLAAEMKDAGIAEKTTEAVWKIIDEQQSWDLALKKVSESGTDMKNRWSQATGERHGSAKAEDWKPKGWEPLDDMPEDPEEVEDLVRAAEITLADVNRRAGMTNAVADDKQKRIDEELRPLAVKLEGLKAERAKIETELSEVTEKRKAARDPSQEQGGMACPHCRGLLKLVRSGPETRIEPVTKGAEMPAAQIKELQMAIAALDGDKGRLSARLTDLQGDVFRATQAQAEITKLEKEIEEARSTTGASQAEVKKAETRLDQLRTYHKGLVAYATASALATKIASNAKIQAVLKPEGLRQQKLTKALAAMNGEMEAFCTAAGYAAVTVQDDMAITYRGRLYGLCSESEKWRARLALQVALVKRGHAALMLVDALDIVEAPARPAILQALGNVGVPVIIAMTAAKPDGVPNMAKFKLGASFWIEAGEVIPLADAPRDREAA